jgi:dihydrofolate reductase
MISIVVGASDNDVIGHLSKLPWYLSRDLKNFAKLTKGHSTIMGRKTFDSIVERLGHGLPERKNIVITRQSDFSHKDALVAHDWTEAVKLSGNDEIFVSGGAEIYKLALPHTDRIYLTRIHTTCDGDVLLPIKNFSDWEVVHQEEWPKDEKNEFDATYYIYERRS